MQLKKQQLLKTIDVILPFAIADVYTYSVPETIECPQPGMRVLVPLARKVVVGIVEAEHTAPLDAKVKVRDVIAVLDEMPVVTKEQLRLWRWIADYYLCPIGDVMSAALPAKIGDKSYSFSPVKKRRVKLPEYSGEIVDFCILDAQQTTAKEQIQSAWKQHDATLLFGVTSSGKTEVYMHLIRELLDAGKQVLYLVPEIALTTQLTDRLQRVFGEQMVVYHSRVSDGVRAEIYRQQLYPKPRLIVGARSAVFLPFKDLGLVIVDEEHEPSYKQQGPAPRYHARSVAIMLAQMYGAKVLLGTATPSVESYKNAQTGKYGLVTMKERFAGLQLPKITLIDLSRQYRRKEMYGHFSDPLMARMKEELANNKQVILFQNRRGYAPMMECEECSQSPKCINCDVPMTLHLRDHRLTCHYCGYSIPMPQTCPHCGGKMKIHGFGTERVEDEVQEFVPEARVLRMDLDSTGKKTAYQDIINAFGKHEVDVLVGTQMVSKGLHFDEVSLVAVLNADNLFNQPDFRCYERAYQLLEQVSGRAGRKGSQGEVIIQTFDPKNPLFEYIRNHDYESFYVAQIAEREAFHYPPFSRMITVMIRHKDVSRVSAELQRRLSQVFGQRCSVVIEPGISKIQNLHIRTIQVRIEATANYARAKAMLKEQITAILQVPDFKSVQILCDIDPM